MAIRAAAISSPNLIDLLVRYSVRPAGASRPTHRQRRKVGRLSFSSDRTEATAR
jgi:hypothetical protein